MDHSKIDNWYTSSGEMLSQLGVDLQATGPSLVERISKRVSATEQAKAEALDMGQHRMQATAHFLAEAFDLDLAG